MLQKPLKDCWKPNQLIGNEKKIYLYLKEKSYAFVTLISKDIGINKYTVQFVLDKLWQNRLVERIGVRDFVDRNNSKHVTKPKKFMMANQKEFAQPRLNVYMIDLGALLGDEENRTEPKKNPSIEDGIFEENH